MSTLRLAIEELRSEDIGSSPDAVVEDDLAELVSAANALEGEILRRLAAVDRRRSFEGDGFVSTVSWLVARLRMSRSKAAELVRVARAITGMPRSRAAFTQGDVTGSRLRVLAHAHETAPEAFARSEELLVDAARSLPVRKLERAVAHWTRATGAAASAEELRRRRWVGVSPTPLGMGRLGGDLDPETNECVTTALQAAVDADLRLGLPGDSRTPGQRRADALLEICRSFLDRGDRPHVGGERPHVNVSIDIASLRGRGQGTAELDHTGITDAAPRAVVRPTTSCTGRRRRDRAREPRPAVPPAPSARPLGVRHAEDRRSSDVHETGREPPG
jgi:uncharacterized protein DUF222